MSTSAHSQNEAARQFQLGNHAYDARDFATAARHYAGAARLQPHDGKNWINLGLNANSTSASHGAWKSAMSLDVNIPVPSKSLLAGNYEGQLTVNIAAF